MIYLGCAGWGLSKEHAPAFPEAGSHLERYAKRLSAVEINSSFYRPHRPQTYARWAASTPEGFRFSVKVPKAITHERRLQGCETALDNFLAQCEALGEKLGCLLVQLPPSLAFDEAVARHFFEALRCRFDKPVVVEPRHQTWRSAQPLLIDLQVGQVGASPSRFALDGQPSGWPGIAYWRLHGVPVLYRSAYSDQCLRQLGMLVECAQAQGAITWCIFDNTASGAAAGDALSVRRYLS
ncbi:DUF72 domain-containing protein [Pseudomonas putida]|uniref:DUF72 domain-containing protein n=1 Tax=Pseudomonas putida TaxID=303 RepID=UPI00357172BD